MYIVLALSMIDTFVFSSAVANSGKELRFKPFMLFDVKLGTETSSNEG